MTVSDPALEPERLSNVRLVWGTIAFLILVVVGLSIVKWVPYWNKAHVAAATHAIGNSIVSGTAAAPPAAGVSAALGYAKAYFLAVWQAVVLALLAGSAVQVFVPRAWIRKLLGTGGFRAHAIASTAALAGMMCTCCTGPVVVGFRRQNVGTGAAMAFFLGNPVLNPAVLIFILFVLGWQFALVRLLAGIAMVFGIAWLTDKLTHERDVPAVVVATAPIEDPKRSFGGLMLAWGKELWYEALTILPGYVVVVLVLGGVRAWLFPPDVMIHGSGIGATLLSALAGTLFVIPTAGEVPIVQGLMHQGLGVGPAIALLLTLPAISLPSIFIVRNVFPPKVLAAALGMVFAIGAVAGIVASFIA